MASVESVIQATAAKDLVPLTVASSCGPGCCDDAETAATDAPCC